MITMVKNSHGDDVFIVTIRLKEKTPEKTPQSHRLPMPSKEGPEGA